MICIPRWEGGGGVGLSCFFRIHVMLPTPAYYIKSSHSSFEKELNYAQAPFKHVYRRMGLF